MAARQEPGAIGLDDYLSERDAVPASDEEAPNGTETTNQAN